jgi:hypothetical protein
MKRKQREARGMAVCDGRDIFIIREGVKIAKRGHPGTPQVGTWVSLEPGWRVLDDRRAGVWKIVVEYSADRAALQ